MANFERILLATDFSETSSYAVGHAVLMARTFNAELHVLHVVESEILAGVDGLTYVPPNYFEELEKQAAEKLQNVISREDRDGLSVTLVMRRGGVFLEIIHYAKTQAIDLIVLGTHGRGALAHVLMGNIAEKVVRKAPCPVLTVRHPHHEFVLP